ncbi:HET-domain-containing protein [Xylaria telfairii]|nr:HET-domain-containing protein [Xylaria telfairii]
MKLLNTTTLHLKDFTGDKSRPPYAILSHTWGEEEVLYEDIMKGEVQWCHKTGATKVRESCKVAKSDRYECDWIWIDTCCIDKKSSAELSEAINSMYKWYSGSKICIAYLADVRKGKDSLSGSRWFTRGWTLQELIAPRDVDFWDRDWRLINNKFGAAQQIAAITNIDRSDLSLFYSVAQLMSWASGRRTTREEDISYSLLGLFNVNMPLLYGEGQEKAFVRLQMAIIEKCDDQSILAWGGDPQDRRGFKG